MSAQEELEKLELAIRSWAAIPPIGVGEFEAVRWADRLAAIREGLGKAQEPVAWMTRESRYRLAHGGNSNGAVPVHGKRSHASLIPLYTAHPADSAQVLVEALEKDAARYRKLRSSNWYIGPMPSCAAYSAGNHFDDRNTSRQELDAAVDALAAHKSEVKG